MQQNTLALKTNLDGQTLWQMGGEQSLPHPDLPGNIAPYIPVGQDVTTNGENAEGGIVLTLAPDAQRALAAREASAAMAAKLSIKPGTPRKDFGAYRRMAPGMAPDKRPALLATPGTTQQFALVGADAQPRFRKPARQLSVQPGMGRRPNAYAGLNAIAKPQPTLAHLAPRPARNVAALRAAATPAPMPALPRQIVIPASKLSFGPHNEALAQLNPGQPSSRRQPHSLAARMAAVRANLPTPNFG